MSKQEQPKAPSYMQQLDQWIQNDIVLPLHFGPAPEPGAPTWDDIVDEVHSKIRAKVLESYRNGQMAKKSGGKR